MMEHKEITRLFVADYDNAKTWAKGKSIFKSIKEDDFFLIFKSGKEIFTAPGFQEIILEIASQSGVIKDAGELDDNSYLSFIQQEIESYSSKDTYVYFLSMEDVYLQLKENLEELVADVQHCETFSASGRTRKKSVKTLMGKDKKTAAKPTNETENDELFETMTTFQVDPSINIPNSYQKPEDETSEPISDNVNNTKEKPENIINLEKDIPKQEETKKPSMDMDDIPSPPKNTKKQSEKNDSKSKEETIHEKVEKASKEYFQSARKKDDTSNIKTEDEERKADQKEESKEETKAKPDPPPRRSAGTPPKPDTKTTSSSNATPPQGKAPNNGRKGPFGNKPQSSPPPVDVSGMTMEELEKMIFGTKLQSVKHEKVYTEMDDARAKYTDALLSRLILNIKKLVKKTEEYNFDDEKYIRLINTFIRSFDYNDFITSWDSIMPGYILGIDEKTYEYIYAEAKYFADTCENIYEKDKWS